MLIMNVRANIALLSNTYQSIQTVKLCSAPQGIKRCSLTVLFLPLTM